MNRIHRELQASLDRLDAQSMRRRLRARAAPGPHVEHHGRRLVNLAANDYLGLSQHPHLKQAAIAATEQLGTGAGASRLVTGHLDLHDQIEQRFTRFKHAPPGSASVLLPTGYMANLAVLTALAGPGDLICLDKLNHASLIDAARATPAEVRTFPHRHHAKLQRLLTRHAQDKPDTQDQKSEIRNQKSDPPRSPRRFIVTDSVFSMDGDTADLPALCELAKTCDAILVVDEAHATGVLGESGAGLCEAQGVSERVNVTVSTASKGLGGLGGIVTAAAPIIDTLINHARTLIYTTAVPPAQAAAIGAALDIVRDEPWRRERVTTLATRLREELTTAGWSLPSTAHVTPIVPLIVGTAERALHLAAHLEDHGLLAVAIRPPTVPPGSARVRLSLRADLAAEDVTQLHRALAHWAPS